MDRNSAPIEMGRKSPEHGCLYELSIKISCDDLYSIDPMKYINQDKLYSVVVMFWPYIAFNIFSVISSLLSRYLLFYTVPGLTVFK